MVRGWQWESVEPDIPTARFGVARFARVVVVAVDQPRWCGSLDKVGAA